MATQAGIQLVISEVQGYVLWVRGPSTIRRRSDGIGFVTRARWREGDVGTNGIGVAMAGEGPVQNSGPEHVRGKCWGLGSGTTKDPGPWHGELRKYVETYQRQEPVVLRR